MLNTETVVHPKLQHIGLLTGNVQRLVAWYKEVLDGNSVEINACNYRDRWAAIEHMQTSPEFAHRPLGVFVDPDLMIAARDAGATPWELHKRAWQGEFEPATPFDPTKLL
jgi:hypothetical protein